MEANCVVDLSKIPDIPHVLIDKHYVDGKDQLRKYPGHYVTVREEAGATYHVSKPGLNCLPSAVLVAEGRLFKDGFEPDKNQNYKNARIIDFANGFEYVYNSLGQYKTLRFIDK